MHKLHHDRSRHSLFTSSHAVIERQTSALVDSVSLFRVSKFDLIGEVGTYWTQLLALHLSSFSNLGGIEAPVVAGLRLTYLFGLLALTAFLSPLWPLWSPCT